MKKLKYYQDLYTDPDVFFFKQGGVLGDVFIMTHEKRCNIPLNSLYSAPNLIEIVGDDTKVKFYLFKAKTIKPRNVKHLLSMALGVDPKFINDDLEITDGATIMYLKIRFPEL